MEEERRALVAFVKKIDELGLGGIAAPKARPVLPSAGGARAAFQERMQNRTPSGRFDPVAEEPSSIPVDMTGSTVQFDAKEPSLLDQTPDDDFDAVGDMSFELVEKAAERPKPRHSIGMFRIGKENQPARA